jgi:hypothetical protein
MELIVNAPKRMLSKSFLKQRLSRSLVNGLTVEEIKVVEGRG